MSFRHLLSLLVLLGLALTPAGMPPASAAAGARQAAATDHHMAGAPGQACADKQQPDDEQAPDDCCVTACTAVAAAGFGLAPHRLARIRQPLPLARDGNGLEPEADPPPPRFS